MEKQKIPMGLIITITVTLVSWATLWGVTKNKIDVNTRDITRLELKHETDIKKLEDRADNTDCLLQNINAQLIELNTKMTLLLQGQLKKEGE